MKILITTLFAIATTIAMSSCGGGDKSVEDLAKEAADYYCQQVKAEKAGDEAAAKEAREKMNEIRKPYVVGDKSGTDEAKAFSAAFAQAKKDAGCDG